MRRGTFLECISYWRLAAQLQKQARGRKKLCRIARRQRTLNLLQEAEEAANLGQARRLYHVVRQLAPKHTYTRMQLRGTEGHLLDEQEGLNALVECIRKTFAHSPPIRHEEPLAITFTPTELLHAFGQLKGRKAVPSGVAPISAHLLASDLIAPHLSQAPATLTHAELLPVPWTNSSMTWVPSKPPTKPEALRPLNLMGAEAKAIAIVIRERLQPYAESYMERVPQFAFLQGRNSLHCILKVHQHCSTVRASLVPYTSNLHHLRQGLKSNKTDGFGALQIALDLSKAFDMLARTHIQDALREAGAPRDLVDITMRLLDQTEYEIRVGECSEHVRNTNRTRQGLPRTPSGANLISSLGLPAFRASLCLRTITTSVSSFARCGSSIGVLTTLERFWEPSPVWGCKSILL